MKKTTIKESMMNLGFKFIMLLTFTFVLLVGQNLFAQGTRGTIRGTVTDPNGAVVTNATVRLINAQKGTESNVQTKENGSYQFLEVEPARYNVIISAPNFAEKQIVDIDVNPNRNVIVDAALTLGQVTDVVTVTAGAELIDRESPTLGTTVENRRIEGLPLNGRNVLNLALLQPGVYSTGGTLSGLGIRVNGNRGTENNVQIDGANNNEVAGGSLIGGITRPDAVQEFRLLTSNFEAEFGRNTGSIINVVTRSGSNDFHGNARFFYRPTELSAANFFDNAFAAPGTDPRQKFDRKEYGFNIGGPIYFLNFGEGGPFIYKGKDRTFFFIDYERRYQKLGGSVALSNLPTAAERRGDFSAFLLPGGGGPFCPTLSNPEPGVNCSQLIYDPLTATLANPAGTPFPGNIIPSNRLSPIANFYLQYMPLGDARGQALASNNTISKVNYFTGRFDHNFTANHNLSFTYNYNDSDTASGSAFGGTNIPGFGSTDLRSAENYVGRYTAVLTPRVVNTFLVGYARNKQPSVSPVNKATPSQIGFTGNFVANGAYAGPPNIRLYDRNLQLGNTIQGPQARVSENIQFQDSLSWAIGGHRLKFGGDYVKYKQAQDFLFINQGIFGYSAIQEEGSNTIGDDFGDFLIGNTPITIQTGANGQRDFRQKAFAGFAQDDWRITRNLSLSLGVRYEYNSPLTDTEDRVGYYRNLPGVTSQLLTSRSLIFEGRTIAVPAGGRAPNGLVYVGDPDPVLGGTVPRGGIQLDKNNIAPRLGFAYSLNAGSEGLFSKFIGKNQTVIRGGVGLYYGAVIGDTALQQLSAPGFNGTNAFRYHPGGTTADPFGPDPFPLYRYLGGADVIDPLANPFTSTADIEVFAQLSQMSQPIDPLIETPEVWQYNLTLERSFLKNYVLGVSYVGNRGKKLYVQEQINPALGTLLPRTLRIQGGTVPTATTGNANSRRVNNDIPLSLAQLTTKGRSQYDSLQVNFQKRFSDDGLTFQIAYTFSKSLADAETQRGNIDILDRNAGWGLSGDDAPHRFVGSFIYELPFFKNTSGFVNRLVDGWSLGGIYTYQSGDLFSVSNSVDTVGTGGGVITFADLGAPFAYADPRAGTGNNRFRAFNGDAFKNFTCGTSFQLCINADGTRGRRGTSGKNQFRLDNPTNNWDFVLAKKTRLWSERANLELRLEAFNAFNTVRFTGINLSLSSSAFGTYTSAAQPRSVQLGARINF